MAKIEGSSTTTARLPPKPPDPFLLPQQSSVVGNRCGPTTTTAGISSIDSGNHDEYGSDGEGGMDDVLEECCVVSVVRGPRLPELQLCRQAAEVVACSFPLMKKEGRVHEARTKCKM